MRTLVLTALLAASSLAPFATLFPAQAQECTGDNCPKPSSGRDCESKKDKPVS